MWYYSWALKNKFLLTSDRELITDQSLDITKSNLRKPVSLLLFLTGVCLRKLHTEEMTQRLFHYQKPIPTWLRAHESGKLLQPVGSLASQRVFLPVSSVDQNHFKTAGLVWEYLFAVIGDVLREWGNYSIFFGFRETFELFTSWS